MEGIAKQQMREEGKTATALNKSLTKKAMHHHHRLSTANITTGRLSQGGSSASFLKNA
jgi:hypothetical protein